MYKLTLNNQIAYTKLKKMGINIMKNCCTEEQLSSQDKVETKESLLKEEKKIKEINIINQIPEIKDFNQFIKYINSKECFKILSNISSRTIFIKKLCRQITPKEIFYFIKNSIQFIISYKEDNDDKKTIKYISMITIYTNLGTKKIIEEINFYVDLFIKEDENFLIRSLSDWVMMILLIRYLYNKEEINLWINKKFDKLIKNYCFDGCYFLIMIKNKYIFKNKDKRNFDKIVPTQINYKINADTTNEVKKLGILIEDFLTELIDCN
jgi:hypothetical protein